MSQWIEKTEYQFFGIFRESVKKPIGQSFEIFIFLILTRKNDLTTFRQETGNIRKREVYLQLIVNLLNSGDPNTECPNKWLIWILGSILSTKNYQNFDEICRFQKISADFQIIFLSKYSEEIFQKSVQPAAPNFFVRKFLSFS